MKKKRVLITGGAGFIGSHLVEYHLSQNSDVWAVDNLQTGNIENIKKYKSNPDFRFDSADVRNWYHLQEAVLWATDIYHMAASVGQKLVIKDPVETFSNNVASCEAVLKSMSETRSKAHLLIASSSEVYFHCKGKPLGTYKEDIEVNFPSGMFIQETYPLSKFVNEVMALSYQHDKNIKATIVRLFNTIGINQSSFYGMVVPNFIKQALANKPITVYGDGSQTRSFNYVLDTVEALSLLMNTKKSYGQIINVGNDRECTILELANIIKKLTNSNSEIQFVPYKKAYGMEYTDVKKRHPDLQKFLSITNYKNQWSLEDTLMEIIKDQYSRIKSANRRKK